VNSLCLNFYRAYSISFNLSNAAISLGVEFQTTVSKFMQEKKKKVVVLCSHPREEKKTDLSWRDMATPLNVPKYAQ